MLSTCDYFHLAMLVKSPSFFIDVTLQPKLKAEFRISMFYIDLCHFLH